MDTRSRRNKARGSREGSSEISVYVALVLIAIGAIGLAYLALTGVHVGSRPTPATIPDSTPSSVIDPTPTPTTASNSGSVPVGLITDGSTVWWTQSVDAGLAIGVSSGPLIGTTGATVAEIVPAVEQADVSAGQPVVIQVGTQDIVRGATAAEIDASIQNLWQVVKDRGGRPIAALIPPSNTFPGSVLTVNNQIRASAVAQGIAILDATTPVASADGTWATGMSDDGLQPNARALEAITTAVETQLPALAAGPTG